MSAHVPESLWRDFDTSPLYTADTSSPLPDIPSPESIDVAQRSGRVGRAAWEVELLNVEIDNLEADYDSEDDIDPEDPPIPEEAFVDIPDKLERDRLTRRYRWRERDDYMNGKIPLHIGPECSTLYPLLVTDPYNYKSMYYTSILSSVELREMVASTALAVLDDADKFTTIVGEDTSGRVPALIIGKAINIVREQHGLPCARRLFISGCIDDCVLPAYRALGDDDHALLITEYICSGRSVNNALAALGRVGLVSPSVATLDRLSSRHHINTDALYMGDSRSYTSRADSHLYRLPAQYKGVTKSIGDPHSTTVELNRKNRKCLASSRKEFDHFAHEIVDIWTTLRDGMTD